MPRRSRPGRSRLPHSYRQAFRSLSDMQRRQSIRWCRWYGLDCRRRGQRATNRPWAGRRRRALQRRRRRLSESLPTEEDDHGQRLRFDTDQARECGVIEVAGCPVARTAGGLRNRAESFDRHLQRAVRLLTRRQQFLLHPTRPTDRPTLIHKHARRRCGSRRQGGPASHAGRETHRARHRWRGEGATRRLTGSITFLGRSSTRSGERTTSGGGGKFLVRALAPFRPRDSGSDSPLGFSAGL